MTVICEECGKVYHIDPDKLEKYKDKDLKVRCGECGHVTQLSNLMETGEQPAADVSEQAEAGYAEEGATSAPEASEAPSAAQTRRPAPERTAAETATGWIGLRGKMFLLFLVIPVVLMAISGVFSQVQLNKLAQDITGESTELVRQAGQEKLMQKARDVAQQCEIYLETHPELDREDFSYDPEFNEIAVQSVGESGYTCLIQEPEPDRGQNWTIWAHPNPNIIGIDDVDMIRKALGPYFDEFFNVLTGSKGRKESSGPYMWKDPDGKIRRKFMAISPIELEGGSPFLLMSTAYMDEFTQKTDSLRQDASAMATRTRNINMGILLVAIVIIGFCITIYGYRLTRNIQYLTEAADRISVGDLEAEIEVKSKDEIGSLADAISRMQDSLRFSIERLRRRR